MKKLFKVGLTLAISTVMVLAMSAVALAADKGRLVVNGNGIVSVDPDLATLYLSIDTNALTAEEAQTKNAEISASVIEAMKTMGIKNADIKTRGYRVNPRYQYNNDSEERKLTGYEVSNNLSVLTADVKNTGKYLDAAVKAGATGNDGVEFSIKNPTKYYGQALTLAIGNAKNSATVMAGALGVVLGKPIHVEENYSGNSYAKQDGLNATAPREMAASAGSGNSAADIRYDKIEISANVNVTYQYE